MSEALKYYVAVGFDDGGSFTAMGGNTKEEAVADFTSDNGIPCSFVLALDRDKFVKPEDAPVVEVTL
jgi:hypothetical protein